MQTTAIANHPFKIYWLSESAVTIEFGNEISEDTLFRIGNFNRLLNKNPFPGFRTSVPAYTTLSIFFDPLIVIRSGELVGIDCYGKVSFFLEKLANNEVSVLTSKTDVISIPVCYGNEFGPDLQEVADLHKLTQQQVIDIHIKATYKVYMIGFVPGFAYMGGMDELIATPRKPTPRKAVPAGSVGIAGAQTGIYPLETPGGWQIIGRTLLKMFDAGREQPALLKAGDNVVFKAIDKQEFEDLTNQ
jgi:inhibitor of KinA